MANINGNAIVIKVTESLQMQALSAPEMVWNKLNLIVVMPRQFESLRRSIGLLCLTEDMNVALREID